MPDTIEIRRATHVITGSSPHAARFGNANDAMQTAMGFEADTLREFDYHIERRTSVAHDTFWIVRVECSEVRETVGWLIKASSPYAPYHSA